AVSHLPAYRQTLMVVRARRCEIALGCGHRSEPGERRGDDPFVACRPPDRQALVIEAPCPQQVALIFHDLTQRSKCHGGSGANAGLLEQLQTLLQQSARRRHVALSACDSSDALEGPGDAVLVAQLSG